MRQRLGKRIRAVPLALAVSVASLQLAPHRATAQAPPPATALVAAPAGSSHLFHLIADGVQIYTCQTRDGGPAWVFLAPEAALFDSAGRQVGTHGAGPHWVLADGSRVTGAVVATAPAPAAGAIPWLLLRATPAEAAGQLRGVGFIRQYDTWGGLALRGTCAQGEVARIRYSSMYGFHAP